MCYDYINLLDLDAGDLSPRKGLSLMDRIQILNVPISGASMERTIALVANWASEKSRSRAVTFCNVHMVALASRNQIFQTALKEMDLNCADGRPLAWLGRRQVGRSRFFQVSGPDFMVEFSRATAKLGLKHYLYGAAPEVNNLAAKNLAALAEGVRVVGNYSPPFRPLSEAEVEEHCKWINESGADIVWVSLGCPKQEWWIHQNIHRLKGKIVLAVGQAFDLLAGTSSRAPRVLRSIGLEWLFRLSVDPRRLWRRYAVYNTIFVLELLSDYIFRLEC